jgi:hypothetical protein
MFSTPIKSLTVLALSLALTRHAIGSPGGSAMGRDYSERARLAATQYASQPIRDPDYPKDAMPLHTARLMAGGDRAAILAAVDRMMTAALKAQQDPFHLHAIVYGERVGGKRWPEELRNRFRTYATRWNYAKPIGVSLNYELMRDGSGWLAAGIWPELVDQGGHNAAKIREFCGKRLRKTLSAIPQQGSTEYDAPLYYGTDFMALRLLSDFADEPDIRKLAHEALEWMLAQTGAHWHRGYAITTAGRAKYYGSQMVCPDGPGATTGMAWLVFGGGRTPRLSSVPQCYWLAYDSPFLRSMEKLERWQAALPVPRTIRASVIIPSHGFFVRKQAWISDGYGLASQRTDGTSPNSYLFKECRGNLLRWVSDKPASTFFVFQDNRRRPHENIRNAFAYGENPYTQYFQHQGTLLGMYAVPESYGFWRMTAPFTTGGAIVARSESGGWIFAHGGSVLFGFRTAVPGTWGKPDTREKFDPYICDVSANAWVIETSPPARFAGGGPQAELERFAKAVIERTRFEADLSATNPRLSFTNLQGRRLVLEWVTPSNDAVARCSLDGKPVRFDSFPRLGIDTRTIYP